MTDGIVADAIKGMHVIDNAGVDFGDVDSLEIDPKTWNVKGLVVKVRRDVADRLPLSKPMVGEPRLELSTKRVQNMTDNIMLNVSVSEIASLLSAGGEEDR